MIKDARTLPPEAQAALRLRVVKAIRAGMKPTEAIQIFAVSRQAIWQWRQTCSTEGTAALAPKKRGPKGACGILKGWQAATIRQLICDRHPEQLKLPFVLWTSGAIRQLIRRKFGLNLSARTVRRYLHRWNFTPQKPKRVAYERNPAAVRSWLQKEYPTIRAQAKREKARLYWGDEMGVRSDHQAGRSYAPKGKTPIRLGTGVRFGANMLSAITNRGELAFMIFKRRFKARTFICFLRRLVRQSRKKVFLIVDGHPVHRSRVVREWLACHRYRIRMILLPAYSPDLNPDEMLNQDVKSNAVGKRSPRNQKQMMRNLRSYLYQRKNKPSIVKRYFHEQSVRYAA